MSRAARAAHSLQNRKENTNAAAFCTPIHSTTSRSIRYEQEGRRRRSTKDSNNHAQIDTIAGFGYASGAIAGLLTGPMSPSTEPLGASLARVEFADKAA